MLPHNHIIDVLIRLLKFYRIRIDAGAIEATILSHPDYPSIKCISDALDYWNIKHAVFKPGLEKLHALGIPVIAHLKQGEFVWVELVTETNVYYRQAGYGIKNLSREEFDEIWSGAVLAVRDVSEAGEPDRSECRRRTREKLIRYGSLIAGALLWIYLAAISRQQDTQPAYWCKPALLAINLSGWYICRMLIRHEMQHSGRFADMFCKHGTHIDCNRVIGSRFSKVGGVITWAELGSAWFIAALLWVTLAPFYPGWVSSLSLFVFAALPVTLWSLAVQAFVIRKWCLFCCASILLLWGNLLILATSGGLFLHRGFPGIFILALLFLACIGAVHFYKKESGMQADVYAKQREIARVKYNAKVIRSQFSPIKYEPGNAGFTFGNVASSSEIALYVGAECAYCGNAVKELQKVVRLYPRLCCRIIFAVYPNKDDITNKTVSYMERYYRAKNRTDFLDMLNAWYAMPKKSLSELQDRFPAGAPDTDSEPMVHGLNRLIPYTPAIFVNGYLLSQMYTFQDLTGIARTLDVEKPE